MPKTRLVFERLRSLPVSKQYSELVERKGLGHPDYMIDAACEEVSKALSNYYLTHFGRILHYNVDKGLLVGGRATPRFGGGSLDEPINILIAGRATQSVATPTGKHEVPIGEIVRGAVRRFISERFRFLNPDRHVTIDYKIRSGSVDLVGLFEEESPVPLSNDTSFGVGFAPFTPLENIVFNTEQMINSPEFKSRVKESGEDCKVMGLRIKNKVILTVADGIVSHLTSDLDHYISVKEEIRDRVYDMAVRMADGLDIEVYVNTGDRIVPGDQENSRVYLTVTGTSAEGGDDGNTGRGNRASGLITPNRQMSLEATAGKNAVSHVGKIYNIAAFNMAKEIYKTGAFEEVYVKMLAQIGVRIDRPLSVIVQYVPARRVNSSVKYETEEIVRSELRNITRISMLVMEDKVMQF